MKFHIVLQISTVFKKMLRTFLHIQKNLEVKKKCDTPARWVLHFYQLKNLMETQRYVMIRKL